MKISICVVLALALISPHTIAADDSKPLNPQGMTLRLELFVTDVEKSLNFYTKVLGFERMKGAPDYAPVRFGAVTIALGPAAGLPKNHHFNPEVQNGRRGLGVEIVLEVDDVKSYFETVKSSGYNGILSPLQRRPWGATDFRIADPDGYYLRITSR